MALSMIDRIASLSISLKASSINRSRSSFEIDSSMRLPQRVVKHKREKRYPDPRRRHPRMTIAIGVLGSGESARDTLILAADTQGTMGEDSSTERLHKIFI